MLKKTSEETDILPLLLQKSFSRPSWTAVWELFLGSSTQHAISSDSLEAVPIFEKPETWPVKLVYVRR